MSEQEFEAYLRLLGRFLRLNDSQRQTIGRELRSHMEDRLDELTERGFTREDAVNTILDEFGDAAALGLEFGRIGRRRKWIMRTTAGTIGVAAAVVLFVSFLLPENRPLSGPPYSHAENGVVALAGADETGSTSTTRPAEATVAATPPLPALESEADRKARQRLAEVAPDVEFPEGTSFEEVLSFFREASQLCVEANWNALGVLGIDRATDVLGLSLHGAKFETVMDIVLDKVGGPDADLGYVVQDGVIRISSQEDLDRKTIVRVYDCADLIRRPLTEAQQAMARSYCRDAFGPAPEAPAAGGSYGGGGFGGGANIRPAQILAEAIQEIEREHADELVDLIKATIRPDTWQPEGSIGSMKEYDGMLVVVHSLSAHKELVDMLTMLRQVRAAREPRGSESAVESAESIAGGFGGTTTDHWSARQR